MLKYFIHNLNKFEITNLIIILDSKGYKLMLLWYVNFFLDLCICVYCWFLLSNLKTRCMVIDFLMFVFHPLFCIFIVLNFIYEFPVLKTSDTV